MYIHHILVCIPRFALLCLWNTIVYIYTQFKCVVYFLSMDSIARSNIGPALSAIYARTQSTALPLLLCYSFAYQ